MTQDDLDLIESRLGVRLPADYRQLAVGFSTSVKPQNLGYEVYDNARQIIARTEELRFGGPTPEDYWDQSHIVIGDSGCGDWYFLDLNESPAPVKCWDHETSSIDRCAASIGHWLSQLNQI